MELLVLILIAAGGIFMVDIGIPYADVITIISMLVLLVYMIGNRILNYYWIRVR